MAARETLKLAFTGYVRSARPGKPFSTEFDAAWEKLRRALISELRKRMLWDAPPRYLGIHGWNHWSEPGALEELLHDCFIAVFVDRLTALQAQAEAKPDIEPLVFGNVGRFILDTQKKHNPLDYRVFKILRNALRRALDSKDVFVLEGDPKIANATILGFSPWTDPETARGAPLDEGVRTWCDDLLPELVTARPSELAPVEETLLRLLVRLAPRGVEAFRFKDLVDPLKSETRARWTAVWRHVEGETAIEEGEGHLVKVVRLVSPDAGFEERQAFGTLLVCVARAIEQVDKTRKTRRHLSKFWGFVRASLGEAGEERLPSYRRMSELLGIPRIRFPELCEILSPLVDRCRDAGRRSLDGRTP